MSDQVPENLARCSECGTAFAEPVTVETALEYFLDIEDASFHCDDCADWFNGPSEVPT